MPNVSESPAAPPAATHKPSVIKSVLLGLLAAVAIVGGGSKMWQGLSTMFGWGTPAAFNKLLTESDTAFKAAIGHAEAADAPFKALFAAVDTKPLDAVRSEQRDSATEAQKSFADGAAQFRLAGAKIDEALKLETGIDPEPKESLTKRAQGSGLLGDVCDQKALIIATVMDESLTTSEAVVAKVLELAKRRDELQAEGDQALTESEAIAKKLADDANAKK